MRSTQINWKDLHNESETCNYENCRVYHKKLFLHFIKKLITGIGKVLDNLIKFTPSEEMHKRNWAIRFIKNVQLFSNKEYGNYLEMKLVSHGMK